MSRTVLGSNSLTSTVVAPCHKPQYAHPIPPMWNIGSGVRLTDPASNPQCTDVRAVEARFRCVVSTPFGTPVVPDVYIWTITSSASPRPPGSTGSCAASQRSYSSPTTTTPGAGDSRSTSPAATSS
jgi:hypothetical protein